MRLRNRGVLFLLALAAIAVTTVLSADGARAEVAKPNVIVILVDAMRADKLGPYGYSARATTPNLNRFASRSVVFQNAISQSAWTVPSVGTLFSGVDPQAHGVLTFKTGANVTMDTMSSAQDTMAEQFKAGGYNTAAIMKSIVVDAGRGYSQGFDTFEVINPKQNQADGESGRELTDAALGWIATAPAAGKPFFLYLHYMDTHSPYKAPEPYYSKYKGSYSGPISGAHVQIEDTYVKNKQVPTAADIERMYGLYDADVEYWDTQFGRLMQSLVASGVDANTIVAVVADHGEAFYEHGTLFHNAIYQENIHIPLIMKVPGVKATKVSHYTQLVDVPPTLADLVGIGKGKNWMGTSQATAVKGTGKSPAACVYCEYGDAITVIDQNGLKLHVGKENLLFDLNSDPTEQKNLASARPDDVTRLKACLEQRKLAAQKLGTTLKDAGKQEMTPEQIEQLKALGYIQE